VRVIRPGDESRALRHRILFSGRWNDGVDIQDPHAAACSHLRAGRIFRLRDRERQLGRRLAGGKPARSAGRLRRWHSRAGRLLRGRLFTRRRQVGLKNKNRPGR